MDGKETTNITVLIAGRPYPLKIKEGDEPVIRKIVKEVNDKINRFQQTYAKKDKQDILGMVLLTYAVDLYKSQQTVPDTSLSNRIQQLDELLDLLVKEERL